VLFLLLQSERFFVEAVEVFDLVQSLFLERSFDAVQNVIYVMLFRPEEVQLSISLQGFNREGGPLKQLTSKV
jgi:hypothetical protein